MQSIAVNHAFSDGNKRTAVVLVDLLIQKSGYFLEPLPGEDVDHLIETFVADCVVAGRWPIQRIEAWFALRIQRLNQV
jgi:death-on-curing protein